MNLIDRYIHEVGHYLPRKNCADIQAELRSLLMDALEARTQGTPTEEDEVALLKEYGPPEKVAASYAPESQYLIGPSLFPAFRTVVGITLAVLVGVHVLVFGIQLAFGQGLSTAANVFTDFFSSALSALGAIVLVFYILQQFDVRAIKIGKEWDPRTLPIVEETAPINPRETVFAIIFGMAFLAFLLVFPGQVGFVPSLGKEIVTVTDPVIVTYLPLIIVSLFLGIGLDVILLWQGRWQTGTRAAKLGTQVLGVFVLGLLVAGHTAWLAENGASNFFDFPSMIPVGSILDAKTVQILVMHSVRLSLFIALVVTLVELVKQAYRFARWVIGEGAIASIVPSQGADLNK